MTEKLGVLAVKPSTAVLSGEIFLLKKEGTGGFPPLVNEVSNRVLELYNPATLGAARNGIKGILDVLGQREVGRPYRNVGELFAHGGPAAETVFDGIALATIKIAAGYAPMKGALETGNKNQMETLFGRDVMEGAGEVVVESTVRDEKLVKMLKIGRTGWSNLGNLRSLFNSINQECTDGNINEAEALLVATYLSEEIETRERAATASAARTAATAGAGAGMGRSTIDPAEAARIRESVLRQKLAYFKSMWGGSTPDSYIAPSSPTAPEWQKVLPPRYMLAMTSLNNAAYALGQVSGIGEVVQGPGNGLFRTDNDTMNFLMNETPGVRETFAYLLQTYFDPIEAGTGRDRHIINVKLKTGNSILMGDFKNLERLRATLVNRLISGPTAVIRGADALENETAANMAVGLAGALVRVGNLFNDADPKRDMPRSNFQNQVWNANWPNAKGVSKILGSNPEPWAGAYGDWLASRVAGSKIRSKDQRKNKEFVDRWVSRRTKPLPERLMVNFFAYAKVESPGHGEVPMIEALYKGWSIDYSDRGSDSWIAYHDIVRSAAMAFEYMKGGDKQKLMLGKNTDEWAIGLRTVVSDLSKSPELRPLFSNQPRGGGEPSPLAERLLYFIGACGGLVDIPELIVHQGAGGYQEVPMRELVESSAFVLMLPEKSDREWILKSLMCGGKGQSQCDADKKKRRSLLGLPNPLF